MNLENKIIDFEITANSNNLNKADLINESFIIWLILVEGFEIEAFDYITLQKIFKRNFQKGLIEYSDDDDFNFIYGWMLTVGEICIDGINNDEMGLKLLYKSYLNNRENLLYKWANRNTLKLSQKEIGNISNELKQNFVKYFNYYPIISDYFKDIISSTYAKFS